MDDLNLAATNGKPILLIGATNRPDSLDPAIRRSGRLDREICMNVPDAKARAKILEVVCRDLRIDGVFDYPRLASLTPGYVGADLAALANEASLIAVSRGARILVRGEVSNEASNPRSVIDTLVPPRTPSRDAFSMLTATTPKRTASQ